MFCKNCGREIDQKTLEKLMRPSGEPAVCPNCGEAVDTAEFCGGFWGLVASSEALQDGSGEETGAGAGKGAHRKRTKAGSSAAKSDRTGQEIEDSSRHGRRIPGVTEADRMLARMILEEDGSRDADGSERSGAGAAGAGLLAAGAAAGHAAGKSDKKAGDSGKTADGSAKKPGGSVEKADSSIKKADSSVKKSGGSGRGTSLGGFRPAAAALLAAAVLVGFLAGRFVPFSSRGGKTGTAGAEQTAEGPGGQGTDAQTAGNLKGEDADAQAESLAQADDGNGQNADSQAGQDILSAQDKEGAANTPNAEKNTLNAEDGTEGGQSGSSPENASGPAGTEGGGYNMIRTTLTEVNGLLIGDSVLYYGSQDSGIIFDGKKLRDVQLAAAGGIAYVKTDIEESGGTLTELNRIYCDKNGSEINNSSGYSRVKYEYDDQGALQKKKYYAMIEGSDKDTKICTSEFEIRESGESGEKNVSVEVFEPSEQAADYEAFRCRKTERTFMSQDSELPGALSTVRYFLQESDPEPVREEIHEYLRIDRTASEEEAEEYDYYVEETIRVYASKEAGETDSGRGGTSAAADSAAVTAEPASSEGASEDEELQEAAETAVSGSTSEAAGFGKSAESAEMAASDNTAEAADSEISAEDGASVMTDLITIRYYFEEDDDQSRLVRMGFYQDGSPAEGKAGYSGFTRSYSAGQTVREDLFFGTGGKTETEDTDSDALIDGYTSDSEPLIDGYTSDSAALTDGDTSDSAALSGGGDEKSAVLLGSEDPLLAGEAVPGYYSAESPWLFLIP